MPRPWRAANSLLKLKEQVNSKWPQRNKASDGLLGDAAHASRNSDHNPWLRVGGVGVVTAMDITHDPVNGPDGNTLSEKLILDSRVKYVIWNRRIWKARTGVWEPYHGPNPHNHHVHVSVLAAQTAFDDRKEWEL